MELIQGLTDQQKMLFYQQYNLDRKKCSTAFLLCLFTGGIGGHHFYFGNNIGILYLLLCWTFLPAFISLLELLAITTYVEEFNNHLANEIVAGMKIVKKIEPVDTSLKPYERNRYR